MADARSRPPNRIATLLADRNYPKYVFQSESAIASFDAFVPTSMARILIADDSELTRSRRTAALSTHADWTIWGEAANGRKAVLLT